MATQSAISGTNAVKPEEKVASDVMASELSAAFLASGIGAFALGLMVVITEMKSIAVSTQAALKWVGPVGPLSGKTGVAVIAFVVSWVALHFALKGRAVNLMTMFIISLVLIALGFLLTFPPVFDLFAQ